MVNRTKKVETNKVDIVETKAKNLPKYTVTISNNRNLQKNCQYHSLLRE